MLFLVVFSAACYRCDILATASITEYSCRKLSQIEFLTHSFVLIFAVLFLVLCFA